MIDYLIHKDINKEKWDACINHSVNRLPYALSWWLDSVSPGWDGLVLDDYRAVMPLPNKKKLGISYLFHPFFSQQLGVFSADQEVLSQAHQFLDAIPSKFRYLQIQMNQNNLLLTKDFKITVRHNYELDLTLEYTRLFSNYHRNCRRNVQKGRLMGLKVEPGPGISIFTRFVENNLDHSLKTINNLYTMLPLIMQQCEQQGLSQILGIYSQTELLAAGWFVHYANRILFMVCASMAKGKENQAMYVLIDHVIAANAGSGKIFDFTGSNMPGVAYFNSGFGAVKTQYHKVTRRRVFL